MKRPPRSAARDDLVRQGPRSRLWAYLTSKEVSVTEAIGATARLRLWERAHGPIPEAHRLNVLVSLIVARRRVPVRRYRYVPRILRHWDERLGSWNP